MLDIKDNNMARIDRYIAELKKDGFTIIKNILSRKDCDFFVNRSNLLLKKLLKKEGKSTYERTRTLIINKTRYGETSDDLYK